MDKKTVWLIVGGVAVFVVLTNLQTANKNDLSVSVHGDLSLRNMLPAPLCHHWGHVSWLGRSRSYPPGVADNIRTLIWAGDDGN